MVEHLGSAAMSRYRLIALTFILALFSVSLAPLAAAQDAEEVVVRVGQR